MSDVRCERLHCHAEGSHIAINLFQPLKQHVGCRQCHSNEELKMVVTECKGEKRLISNVKCINMFGDCGEK